MQRVDGLVANLKRQARASDFMPASRYESDMQFTEKVREAKFIKRYKRFFADVLVDGATITAHVPNTGSMKTCLFDGADCIVTETADPKRKLKATLHFLKTPTGWVGVNTSLPNLIAYEAWESKLLPDWHRFSHAIREHKLSKETRLDLLLSDGNFKHYVEIKNVTYAEGETAYFPDAVSTRGQKHLEELIRLKQEGHSAEILFIVQREGCTRFAPLDSVDPVYGRLLREAKKQGVVVRALACHIDPLVGVRLTSTPLTLDF